MAMRRKLRGRANRRSFRKGSRVQVRNLKARPMRGGIRL